MKLISTWRSWWRMYSEWAFAAILTIQGSIVAYLTPAQLAAPFLLYPGLTVMQFIAGVVSLLAITGGIVRLIPQDLPDPKQVDVET